MRPGRGFAIFGLLVCLQAACASASRGPAPESIPAPTQPGHAPSDDPAEEPPPESSPGPDAPAIAGPAADPDECALVTPHGEPIATVALTDPIDRSRAPRPSNQSERLVFRQLYETLLRVDCTGRVLPGLAGSWRLDADGVTWIVTLRADARFADGTPVTPADVRASWLRQDGSDTLHADVSRLVESIAVSADHTLAIRLHNRRAGVPTALAHPDLAVARASGGAAWPLGTRGAQVAPVTAPAPAVAAASIAVVRDALPPLRFLVARNDPRDFLDRGVDLMVTRDPAALAYAATLPQFTSVPLEWQRTYVLLTPGRPPAARSLPPEARRILAEDAVRGEARGALEPFWWQTASDCTAPAVSPAGERRRSNPQIVYDANDPVARDLAERFVGLARAAGVDANPTLDALLHDRPRRTFQHARGLTGAALAGVLRRGADAGYIVALGNRPLDPCRDLQALLDSAPWLDAGTILPLVEAREQAIVRRGAAGLSAEWDAGLLISAAPTR